MPLKENEVALAQAVNLVVQREKRVNVTTFRVESIEIRPEQKIVSAYILLRLDDDKELEKRVTLFDGEDFNQDADMASFLEMVSTKVKLMTESGAL